MKVSVSSDFIQKQVLEEMTRNRQVAVTKDCHSMYARDDKPAKLTNDVIMAWLFAGDKKNAS